MREHKVNGYVDKGMRPGMGMAGRGRLSLSRQTFLSFKNRVFRIYYGSLIGQMAALNMQMLANSYLIYDLSGSAAILGLMALAQAFPMLLLSLFGGVMADRVQKKTVMFVGGAISAVPPLGIALALTSGYLSSEQPGSWWVLFAASIMQGTVWALVMPSRQAIVPEIVGNDQLMNAMSLNMLGNNLFRLFGPAITGFLLAALGYAAIFYIMSGLYLAGSFFLLFMPPTSTISLSGGGALASIKDGVQYIRHKTVLIVIMVFTLVVVILSMPYMSLMPIFAKDILDVGAQGMGVLLSVSGTGALVGSIVLASLPNKKRGLIFLAGSLLLGLALVGFAFSNSWTLSLVIIIFVGLGQTIRMTLASTLLQYYVEEGYRGRVMSIYMMEFGLTSFGTFAAALLAESIGVQWAVGGFAIVLVVISVLALVFLSGLRKLD